MDTFALPFLFGKRGVVAPDHHIGKIEPLVHTLGSSDDVFRIAGIGVEGHKGAHTADLEIRVDLMPLFHRQRTGDKFVVYCLIHSRFGVLVLGIPHTGTGPAKDISGCVALVVDLIEGHPVFHFISIPPHDRLCEPDKETDDPPVHPAAVLLRQMVGHLKVGERDDRFNAISQQFIKELVIEPQAGLVGRFFITVREDTGPGDGCAETFEAHLRHEGNILPEGVVEVDAVVIGVVFPRLYAVRDAAHDTVATAGEDVGYAGALAVRVPCALQLVGSHRAAP